MFEHVAFMNFLTKKSQKCLKAARLISLVDIS